MGGPDLVLTGVNEERRRIFPWRDFFRYSSLPADARIIGLALMTFANGKEAVWPSLRTLKAMTGMGRNRIERARAALVKGGYFKMEARRDADGRICGKQFRPTDKMFMDAVMGRGSNAGPSLPAVAPPAGATATVPAPVEATEAVSTLKQEVLQSSSSSIDKSKNKNSSREKHEPIPISQASGSDGDKSKGQTEERDLPTILAINGERIKAEDMVGFKYLVGAYDEAGRPAERNALEEFLNTKIKWCKENGVTYPSVILKRLKQIQRGELNAVVQADSTEIAGSQSVAAHNQVDDLKRCLRGPIFALWESRQCRAAGDNFSARCRALLTFLEEKHISLNSDERDAIELFANASAHFTHSD